MLRLGTEQAWLPFEPTQSNPWSTRYAAHLYRRAGFGGTIRQIKDATDSGLNSALEKLFDMSPASAFEQEMEVAGRMVGQGADARALSAWWLLRMSQTPVPLLEKMTLFWHGHFATGAEKVMDSRLMLAQNKLIRKDALGKVATLVTGISRDVAMLTYLDSTDNRKTRPNENYARELMELFCLGPGNYSEKDIKEIARCFTGWEIRRNKFRFNQFQHDTGTKSFLGTRGVFDGDDAIRIVMEQPACARFIAKKLIRFFVFDGEEISDELAEPLAKQLRDTAFDIAAVLKTIFASRIFYSDQAIARKIKSPVELSIGTLRFFGASINMQQLANRLSELGQLPFYPPTVKGWDGGRTWINASTVLARANLISSIFSSGDTNFESGGLVEWGNQHISADVGKSLDWVSNFLLAVPLPVSSRTLPNSFKTRQDALRLLNAVSAIPEYQMA